MRRLFALSVLGLAACAQLAGLGTYGEATGGSGGLGGSRTDGGGGTSASVGGQGGVSVGGQGGGSVGSGGMAPSAYAEAVLDDVPVAYYRLDDADGTIAADSAGPHHANYPPDGSFAPVAGLIHEDPNAAVLIADGLPDYIDIEAPASLDDAVIFYLAFSLEIWARPTKTKTAPFFGRLIRKVTGSEAGFQLDIDDAFNLRFIAYHLNVPDEDAYVAGATLAGSGMLPSILHIVATHDPTVGGAGELKLYANGVLWDSELLEQPLTVGDGPLQIGRGFYGTLDEVAIYKEVLSEQQVQDHYALGSVTPSSP